MKFPEINTKNVIIAVLAGAAGWSYLRTDDGGDHPHPPRPDDFAEVERAAYESAFDLIGEYARLKESTARNASRLRTIDQYEKWQADQLDGMFQRAFKQIIELEAAHLQPHDRRSGELDARQVQRFNEAAARGLSEAEGRRR